jgi:hypothetical protein
MNTRRTFIAFLTCFSALGMAAPAFAQELPKPFVIYDDELKNGWENHSWAKVALSTPGGGAKPIKVEGDPWSALMLHHASFSTEGYTKLTFFISGGKDGGQSLMIKAKAGETYFPSTFVVQPKAKTWAMVEVPLKDIGAEGKKIDAIAVQGQADAYGAYYITRIQLE